jgi:hypothetical protein
MTGYLTDYSGKKYTLPTLLSWSVTHGLGSPCDCYEVVCRYDPEMEPWLKKAYRFTAVHEGKTVFYGVVDETQAEIMRDGRLFSISGRGLAALLLDNEAETAQYYACSIRDILDRHVYPWGIRDVSYKSLGYLYNFDVDSGESEWSVLSRFTAFAAGITPRFTREGKLVISDAEGKSYTLDRSKAFDFIRKERRYGVISSVLVKNKVRGTRTVVTNDEFISRGGLCRHVLNVPRLTGYNAMRYTGAYQINESKKDSTQYIVTLPTLFAAEPNDIITVDVPEMGAPITLKAGEVTVWANGTSSGTEITLVERQ